MSDQLHTSEIDKELNNGEFSDDNIIDCGSEDESDDGETYNSSNNQSNDPKLADLLLDWNDDENNPIDNQIDINFFCDDLNINLHSINASRDLILPADRTI